MISAPLPANEAERLYALRSLDILDSDNEVSFDRVTAMAARHFGAPICAVSLLDEHREWFKSAQGIGCREGDRGIAFCAHVILGRDVFVIEDTLENERFHDNPQVTAELHIRFYAGASMVGRTGMVLGAFCIKDYAPIRRSTNPSTRAETARRFGRTCLRTLLQVRIRWHRENRVADSPEPNERAVVEVAHGLIIDAVAAGRHEHGVGLPVVVVAGVPSKRVERAFLAVGDIGDIGEAECNA